METLVAGNTAFWTQAQIRTVFDDGKLVFLNQIYEKFGTKKREEKLRNLFRTYEFDRVIYISEWLSFGKDGEEGFSELCDLLKICAEFKPQQILYMGSAEAGSRDVTQRHLMMQAEEKICQEYAQKEQLFLKLIRSPYLSKEDYDPWPKTGRVIVPHPAQEVAFADAQEIPRLWYAVSERWDREYEQLQLKPECIHRTCEIVDEIKKTSPQLSLVYESGKDEEIFSTMTDEIRRKYGFFLQKDGYHKPEEVQKQEEKTSKISLLAEKMVYRKVLRIGEIIGLWLIAEALIEKGHLIAGYQYTDLRLLLIVLVGGFYGVTAGGFIAALESVSVLWMYARDGRGWETILYEPSNWIIFIIYFIVGTLCGYARKTGDERRRFLEEEKELLLRKYEFLSGLYEEALAFKTQYKKQILGSKDSFGRMFEVVRTLDSVIPREVYAHAVPVMEDLLDNDTIALYSVGGRSSAFGRLEVSSQKIRTALSKSIRLEQYQEAIQTIQDGEIWVNRELKPDRPMYMAGIKGRDGSIELLIVVYEADFEQTGMYYENLFRMICGLIENTLRNAWDYQQAARKETYLGDTIIMRKEHFAQRLENYRKMAEDQIASYGILKILPDGRSTEEISEMLETRIRETDLLGSGMDGNYYLILPQIDEVNIKLVAGRLEQIGLKCIELSGGME